MIREVRGTHFLGVKVKDTLSQQIQLEDVLGLSQNDRPPPDLLEMVQLKFEGTRFEQRLFWYFSAFDSRFFSQLGAQTMWISCES